MTKHRDIHRRTFLQTSVAATITAATSRASSSATPLWEQSRIDRVMRSAADPTSVVTLRDVRVKALALQAIDAARSAGAHYADVRMTNTVSRGVEAKSKMPGQTVNLGLSVRALVNGAWGWAATPILSTDEAVRVARLATTYAAHTAVRNPTAHVELDTIPVVADGEWTTPVKIDPFTLNLLDLHEWMSGLSGELGDLAASYDGTASIAWQQPGQSRRASCQANFEKQERVFASTEGTFLTQTVLTISPAFQIGVTLYNTPTPVTIPGFNMPVQAGWERIADTPIVELLRQQLDEAYAAPPPPQQKHVDIGRYDCVFSAAWVAQILSMTLAPATEPDRMLGFEANRGTSYLGTDPLAVLGKPVASPMVNITAERSNPLGLATVKWDAEGVAPTDFPLIKDGVLVDVPTTREQAAWVAPWSAKQGHPVRSRGCASAPSALEEPMQHLPNLVLHPGPGTATEESLIQELEHGFHFSTGVAPNALQVDWQGGNGYFLPVLALEIRRGKVVGFPQQLGLLFRTNQFWKNLHVLGGRGSEVYVTQNGFTSMVSRKGDPLQSVHYSIGAVPARIQQLAFIDPARKA